MSDAVLVLQNINKTFRQGKTDLPILKEASLEVKAGEILALIGPSGCGKSTMLQIAGLLDKPDSGLVKVNGKNASILSDKKRTMIRRHDIGYIYQFHHLLPEFSALDNVAIPQIIAGINKKQARHNARKILENMGLSDRIYHQPGELSGGEQQRVAIARSLSNNPSIVLADEPTGNLDPETADMVFKILLEQIKVNKLSMLMVTHDKTFGEKADRIVTIDHGHIESI